MGCGAKLKGARKNKNQTGGRGFPSLPRLFIVFLNSHYFPLSERLEQASVVSLNYNVYDFCERTGLYEAFLEPN